MNDRLSNPILNDPQARRGLLYYTIRYRVSHIDHPVEECVEVAFVTPPTIDDILDEIQQQKNLKNKRSLIRVQSCVQFLKQ